MKRAVIILTLTLVGIAGGAGFWLGRKLPAGIAAAEKTVESEVGRLRAENMQLRSALQTSRKHLSEEAAPRSADTKLPGKLDTLRAFTELKEQNLVVLSGTLLSPRDGKITEAFVKLFGLSSAETATLQEAINAGRRKIEALILANTTAEVKKESVVVSTKPFEGGAEIYDEVLDTFAQTLGPERFAVFLPMTSNQLGASFGQFGAEQRTVTVTREVLSGDKTPMFIVQDHHKHSGGNSGTNNGRARDVKNLSEMFRILAPYAPQISALPVKTVPGPK